MKETKSQQIARLCLFVMEQEEEDYESFCEENALDKEATSENTAHAYALASTIYSLLPKGAK